EASPEMVAIQHRSHVGMRELARHLERGRQRANESRPAHELEHGRDTYRSDDFARFPEVVYAARVIVTCKFFSCSARADEAIDTQLGGQRRSVLELFQSLAAPWIRLGETAHAARRNR